MAAKSGDEQGIMGQMMQAVFYGGRDGQKIERNA
jgi:hypothetical protein